MFDLNKTIYSGFLLFMCSCAAITSPEGGPKDETPPKVIEMHPENLSKNVKTQTITIRFDEPIQVLDLQKQLLITPDAGNIYKHKITKNALILTFEEPFEENTTYTFQFREGVKDITEGNVPEKLEFIFTTGSDLDSGRVEGEVVNLLSNNPENDFTVGLYRAADTGSVRTVKPYYVTKTNSSGQFNFNYIKEGNYKIFAFNDANNNLLFNETNEKIAYLPEEIYVTDSTKALKLQSVRIDTRKPFISKTEAFTNLNRLTFNEGIANIKFLNDSLPYNLSENGLQLDIYNSRNIDQIKLPVIYQDSSFNSSADTLKVRFTGKPAPTTTRGYLVENNQNTVSKNEPVKLNFEIPVTITGSEPIRIIEDSATSYLLKYPEQITVENNGKSISFKPVRTAKKQVEIQLDSVLIKPVNNDTISYPRTILAVTNNQNTGSLSGIVKTEYENYVVQLLNENKEIEQEFRSVKNFKLNNVWPATYTIRVLIDENNDERWTGGDPELKKPAEKIYFYPDPITIRANWEMADIELEF